MSGSRTQPSFDFNRLRSNIQQNIQDVVNEAINSEPLNEVRKMFYKSCNSCGSSFTLFQRKKRCQTCMLHFCIGCTASNASGDRRCRRCIVYNQVPLTKESLNSLRVRDLKWILDRMNISTATYSEKRELVDLIIESSGRRPSANFANAQSQQQQQHQQRQTHSQQQQQQQRHTYPQQPSSNPSVIPSREPSTSSVHSSASFHEPTEESSAHSTSVPSTPTNLHPNLGNFPSTSSNDLSPSSANQETNLSNAASTPNLSKPNELPSKFEPFNLSDITNETQIRNLSIRQLKIVLSRNYVDYRGCIERDELVERTIRLWKDKQEKQKYMEENEDNLDIDTEVCKICMDKPIDCVLLECGHMVTCTDCGKILPECPICRQFVSRVVHVFKS